MTDYISRADAIDAVCREICDTSRDKCETMADGNCGIIQRIEALPSAELPKGDLISRADAVKAFKEEDLFQYCNPNDVAQEIINDIPSADAEFADLPDIPRAYYEKIVGNMSHEINMLKQQLEDRPSGEWIKRGTKITCSNCKSAWSTSFDTIIVGMRYCPSCGAYMGMKGGADNG